MRSLAVLVTALAAFAASAAPAGALPDEPDLVIRLPAVPTGAQVAPVFVDAFEQPGHLLYRFDAVIANQGGTLDLFRDPGSGGVRQAVWPGGEPTTAPKPDVTPSGPEVRDRSGFGSGFEYAYEKTHQHFHFSSAARYELQPEGGAARTADKVGFCMFDTYRPEPAHYFRYAVRGLHGETWCGFNAPGQPSVRMGLSPGGADLYSAQRERQWVDISGLEPGPAVMRARANPLHCILESDEANNSTSDARQIPGVRVAGATGSTGAGTPLTLALAGTVVAPDVPARRSGGCTPGSSRSCYVWASAGGPLTFRVVEEPAHGTVALAPGGGLRADATYTPAAGFAGEDAFTYVATDARGLSSSPATVRVSVAAPGGLPSPPPVLGGSPAPRARLTAVRVLRRRGLWRVVLRSSAPARLSGRLERRVRGRRVTRRLRSRRVAAGPARVALGRLARGRYRLRLAVDGTPAATATFRVRGAPRF
ncbi:MAG: lysyl oxidase-like protein 1 [Solirubrobacteraceae bacterium]|nr:lysyl oxidase-like protein 1 [Solirubrobacteraceae bacterium]